ncbi:MAG TPA: hypothetical protein VFO55_11795 [Gemmatimonadaceae bacterium]|nr:hypothetical protein [Gemmatimonadaceae bacterium]
MTLLFVCALSGCARSDKGSETRDTTIAVAVSDTDGVERPQWKFGESSVRADTLPAELDSLRDWGDYDHAAQPVAYAIDLNQDGRMDWLVRAAARLCGPAGGCPARILTRDATGRFITVFDGLARDLMVTDRMVNGWPVLWTYLGGIDGGVFRMEFRRGRYETTATLLSRRDMNGWTDEQYAVNPIWQRIQSVPSR